MAYGMMDGFKTAGWGLLKLLYFVVAVFVSSAIFWLTYKWLVEGNNKKKKKR